MNAAPRIRLVQPVACLPRICIRQVSHSNKAKKPTTGFVGPEGHGEKIFIWSHRRTEQAIYTLRNRLVDHHDLKQLPFNGKKTKPDSLRRDYWSKLATLEFPDGQGSVGRSIFQKLRELKHLHEVSWPEDLRIKPESEYTKEDRTTIKKAKEDGYDYKPLRSKKERGKALNAQKKNSIADLAAVLAGEGRGNKIVVKMDEGGDRELVPVTVRWANDQDKNYAESWSDNVTHSLLSEPSYVLDEVAPNKAQAAQA